MPLRLASVVIFCASAVCGVAATCEDAIGQWAWFTKGVVTIKADGTFVHNPNNDGSWTCTDASRGLLSLKWRVGGFVNNMLLSADGRKLTSTDPGQAFVTGARLGGSATAARTGPSTTPSTEPSRAPATGDLAAAYNASVEGRRLAAAGRCRDAIPYFHQAIRGNPNDAKAYSDRGRCTAILGDLNQGLKDLDRAVQLRPNDMSPYFNRAGLRADSGDGDGALADLDWSVHLNPLNPAPRAARAAFLMVAGRAEEAQLDLDTAYRQVDTLGSSRRPLVDQILKTWRAKSVRLSPLAPPSGNPLEVASAALKTGRYRAALAALDAANLHNPADDTALAMRARLRLDIGQAAQALADLNIFLQRHPSAIAYTDRGRALRQLARFREEIGDYDRAVRADPNYAPAYMERAFTTMHFVKGNDPSPDLTKVIQLEPQNWRAYYMRGQEYGYWNNKLHLAVADYRRVVELQPSFAQAYCDMAFALRELQRMNEVEGLLQKCYALDPSEREVTKKVFARIKAGEEQAARDMAAMANYGAGGLDDNDPRVAQKRGAINAGQCAAASGNWTGAYGCK